MKKYALILTVAALAISACNNETLKKEQQATNNTQNELSPKSEKEKHALLKEIEELNTQVLSDTTGKINRPLAFKLVYKYETFVKQFTNDNRSPEFAFKAADIAQGLGDGQKAVFLYNFILEHYPSYTKYPEALFLKAFVLENILQNLGEAKKTYTKFMVDFPEHELYDDAEASIKYMGKTPEELIKEFETKNKNN